MCTACFSETGLEVVLYACYIETPEQIVQIALVQIIN